MLNTGRKASLIAAFAVVSMLGVSSGCRGFFVNPTLSSIAITPNPASVQVGASVNLTATANFSDGTTKDVTGLATWTSSDTSQTFVTVSSVGLVTGVQNTTSAITVTASYKNVSGTTSVTVGQTVTITCTSCTGNTISLSANGGTGTAINFTSSVAANWSSSNSSIIAISTTNSTSGAGTLGGTTGTVTITASGTSGGTGTLQVTVNP